MARKKPSVEVDAERLSEEANTPSVSQLHLMENLVQQAIALQAKIEHREALIKLDHAALYDLTHRDIPMAMQAAGVSEFKTEAGLKVSIADIVQGNIPKEEIEDGAPRKKALDWLRANGAAGIIKEEVSLRFGKGENKEAARLKALLKKSGFKEYDVEIGVHVQTLWAWAREALRAGKSLPVGTLGIYLDHKAVITPPKEAKAKP